MTTETAPPDSSGAPAPIAAPTAPTGPLAQPLRAAERVWDATRPYAPAIFFFGGFAFDSVTLGRAHTGLDVVLLFAYYLGASGALFALARGLRFRGAEYLNWTLQFCFGALFSALTILYFKSAGSASAFLFVTFLAALLVGNEFLEERYGRLSLSWAVFTFCGVTYLNFALPHLVGRVGPFWFFASTALALAAAYGLRRLATVERPGRFGPAVIIAVAFAVAYLLNWIPPVPLVRKDLVVCRALDRTTDPYTAQVEAPPLWHFWKRSERKVRHRPDEKIWFYASVFAPVGIEADVAHQWWYEDPQRGWTRMTRVPLRLTGGRTDGFRTWSHKQNLPPGRWRVTCETANGQVIGESIFRVVAAEPAEPLDMKTVTLR